MKTPILYKILFLLIWMPTMVQASSLSPIKEKHTKEKTIKKSFNVNPNATFNVTNRYGNINVITWNENRIDIEVSIKVEGNNEDRLISKLNQLDVAFQAAPNKVSAITSFDGNSYDTSWWNKRVSNNIKMEINYVVKIPITNNVQLFNDYGNITLDKLEGNALIKCDYGKITTKELMGNKNELRFDYTKDCYFEYIKTGTIDADYSSFTIAKTNDISIKADYTSSHIETAEDIIYNCDYGSMKIDRANNIDGQGDYLTLIVGDVYKNVSIDADYGSIKIDRLKENTENVTIKSDYTGIKIGYEPSFNFQFDITLEYASLSGDNDFNFSKKHIESRSKYYAGYHGNTNTNGKVTIDSDYGSVTFHKN